MSSVDKIKWAMSLRDPQYEALQYFDAISSKIEYRTTIDMDTNTLHSNWRLCIIKDALKKWKIGLQKI